MARLVVQLGLLWAHACADDFVARRVREIAGEHGATGHQALSRYEAHPGVDVRVSGPPSCTPAARAG